MDSKMKVLILTVPLGNGHNAVARALRSEFDRRGDICVTLDLYEYIHPSLKAILSKLHTLSMKSAQMVKDLATGLYYINEKREKTIEYSPAYVKNKLMALSLLRYIEEFDPDIILCTQVYAAQVVDGLAEEGKLRALTVGIITDFTVQVYWEDTESIHYIVTPSRQLDAQLAARGIAPERVLHFGIPIAKKFAKKLPQREAAERIGVDPSVPVVLLMGGGAGLGKVEEYVEQVDAYGQPLQMIAVCGHNDKLREKLLQIRTRQKLTVYGFREDIDVIMDASDCLISKPGGITIAESLAKELPLIMIDQLPGVEDRNVEFLLNNGAALHATKTYPLWNTLDLLFRSQERRRALRTAMRGLACPQATQELCEFLAIQMKSGRE